MSVARTESDSRVFGGSGNVFDENKITRTAPAATIPSAPKFLAHGKKGRAAPKLPRTHAQYNAVYPVARNTANETLRKTSASATNLVFQAVMRFLRPRSVT